MCGFCFKHGEQPGSCLAGNSSQYSDFGPCSEAEQAEGFTWYSEYCPTSTFISWTIIVALAAYLISFAAGIAPIPWTVNAEIYPLWARAVCTSIATSTNWSAPSTSTSAYNVNIPQELQPDHCHDLLVPHQLADQSGRLLSLLPPRHHRLGRLPPLPARDGREVLGGDGATFLGQIDCAGKFNSICFYRSPCDVA